MFRHKLLQVMTGRYVGELDGTTKLEWVKAWYFRTMVVTTCSDIHGYGGRGSFYIYI